MTTEEKNRATEFLQNAECADWIMGDDRRCVEVMDSDTERYALVHDIDGDEDETLIGMTNDVHEAVKWLAGEYVR